MKLKTIVMATLLAASSASAYAGDFTNLPDSLSSLSEVNGGLVKGANSSNSDKMYVDNISTTWLSGYEDLIPQVLNYNAIATSGGIPRPVTGSGTLTLLAYNVTEDIEIGGEEIGHMYDMVFRDSRDNALVFGTRVTLGVEPDHDVGDGELNFLYRYGFTGFSTAAAWTYVTDYDLRLYQAGRTADDTYDASVPFDADTVRMKSDVSVAEGNPYSGLFLIKTNAQYYAFDDEAVGYFQAGEEGQPRVGGVLAGYVAAVPEPESYAMFLAGLGMLGFVARRKSKV